MQTVQGGGAQKASTERERADQGLPFTTRSPRLCSSLKRMTVGSKLYHAQHVLLARHCPNHSVYFILPTAL